jgi:DNA-binding transcriptional MerR regulator
LYGPEDVTRLDFIRKAKRLGLSLGEIRGILQLHDRREPTCRHVRGLLNQKLAQIDQAVADLTELRSEVSRLRDRDETVEDCGLDGAGICSIIEEGGIAVSDEALVWARPSPARG